MAVSGPPRKRLLTKEQRLEAEVGRLRAERDSFQRVGIRSQERAEQAEARLREVVEALRVLIDSSYWENMADYERAMNPSERAALATVLAVAQPEEEK